MRTITAVTPKDGQTELTLSDGAVQEFGGFEDLGGTPDNPNHVVALRDASGTIAGDTPPLDYAAALLFQAAGVSHPAITAVLAKGPEAAAVSPEPVAPPVAAPVAAPVAPGVVVSAEDHQKSKGILARIESYLNTEEKALVAELRAILKHV